MSTPLRLTSRPASPDGQTRPAGLKANRNAIIAEGRALIALVIIIVVFSFIS